MTLKKAIKILEWNCPKEGAYGNPVINEATRLGIEAMKDLQLLRYGMDYELLPGETKGET